MMGRASFLMRRHETHWDGFWNGRVEGRGPDIPLGSFAPKEACFIGRYVHVCAGGG
jgi:hypothetical protein